ncbi:hypothetical protein EDC04DRAFT_2895238 [Pisolithus marmoratus]|nr:hypothetical protein EDC04DRAFT_2895238 [Pisolithus marmoratus]
MDARHYPGMPLDPLPSPSPRVGKRYHSFPKGSFKACFIPPSAPHFILKHLAAHPPTWTWTTKGGPNKDHSFQVPTIPITCDKAAPRAIHWVVAVFHSFKAHLNPIAIDGESGKVKPGWLRLYQNNLYVHLRGQMKETTAPKRASPPNVKPSPTSPPLVHPKPTSLQGNLLEAELSKLCQEIAELRDKFLNYITSHEACCTHRSNSPSESSEEDHTAHVTPRPPPGPAHPPSGWVIETCSQPPDLVSHGTSPAGPSHHLQGQCLHPIPIHPYLLVPRGNTRSHQTEI